ncbi:hypothetical protein F5888DRAFT_1637919 [Russula emetica]|nr:hypothetical protein F5888DRAFT_1637919 [Russula emetica]
MSFELDFIQYPSSKGTDAMEADLFFAPDPQYAYAPSSESFDQEVDNDKEFEELDLDFSFKQFDDFFATFRDTIPVVPTSAVTHSTESLYDVPSSQYSCDLTLSEYSIPSEIESCGSVNDGFYGTHASVYSAAFSNSPPSIPPPSPAKAVAVQKSTPVSVSAAVHMVPDEAHGPVKPFKCLLCPFSSARKHNLKTHIETHNKEGSKRFGCNTCGRPFTRRHDLKRHRATMHRERMSSSSSVSSISKRSFDPMPDRPNPCIALNGDPTPMSAYPDFDTAIDVPENIIAWLLGV